MKLSKDVTLSDAVKQNFRYAEVFEKFGLDYCCNGKRTIEVACASDNIEPDTVLSELEKSTHTLSDDLFMHIDKWENKHIIELVVNHFHKDVHRKTQVINFLLDRVCTVHGANHPELLEIQTKFEELSKDLVSHMRKEEEIVFPYILKLNDDTELETPPFGSIENPLSVLMNEHESAGRLLEDIKRLSDNYTPPQEACLKYTTLFLELEEFEKQLHRHVHLENNILFDKARNLENKKNQFINN